MCLIFIRICHDDGTRNPATYMVLGVGGNALTSAILSASFQALTALLPAIHTAIRLAKM